MPFVPGTTQENFSLRSLIVESLDKGGGDEYLRQNRLVRIPGELGILGFPRDENVSISNSGDSKSLGKTTRMMIKPGSR
jgi:hypothetical protein